MTYDIDEFVNNNKANVFFDEDTDEDICTSDFEKLITFDNINSDAYPVYVYESNTKAVAWYDIEMFEGYKS